MPESIRPFTVSLTNAVMALQKKIEGQTDYYAELPLAQEVTVGTGETMLRANPAAVEYRATVRDYAAALKSLSDILDAKHEEPAEEDIDSLRKKFKVM